MDVMNPNSEHDRSRGDAIDELLPWHVTGRLDPADSERVDAALAADPDLARRLAIAEEEFRETVSLNEALGAPSVRARDALFARIDAAGVPASRRAASQGGGWWTTLVAALSPRTLAWSAAAAALVIAVQAGTIGTLLMNERTPGFVTASGPEAASGSRLLVGFAPEATVAQITAFLQGHRAVVVDGPRAGGVFLVRVGERPLAEAESQQVMAAMRAQGALVRFVAPSP